ncbi:TPA: Holliday junction resolvase RuvX [bacterium]|nr:Holliday junction resolvase RuvX [bacterium]
MKILGLDVGDVLIGVAVSDPSEIIAQGLDSIRRVSLKKDIQEISLIIKENDIEKIIIGLPKMLNNEIGIQAQKVMDFVEKLRKSIDIPIIMWDERLSTVSANRTLIEANISRRKRKNLTDKMAATIILQGYLDSQ